MRRWSACGLRLGWWLIGRLVRRAVPVDGILWVDLNACGSRHEDSAAAATRPGSQEPAERVTMQRVRPTDGSALG
jgi:hypothetical protein